MGQATTGALVAFDDVPGYPKFSATRKEIKASRVGYFNYEQLDALIEECFPWGHVPPGTFPGRPYLFVHSVEVEPFPAEDNADFINLGSVPTYPFGRATIQYSTLEYDPFDMLTRKYTFGGEAYTLPASGIRWASQPAGQSIPNEDARASKLIPTLQHELTYHRVYGVPWSSIVNCIGRVNDNWFEGAAPGTLLFIGAEISFNFSNNGIQTWTISYQFHQRIITEQSLAQNPSGTPPGDQIGPDPESDGAVYPQEAVDPGYVPVNPPADPNDPEDVADPLTRVAGPGTPLIITWNHFYRPDKKCWEIILDDLDNPIYPKANFYPLFTAE